MPPRLCSCHHRGNRSSGPPKWAAPPVQIGRPPHFPSRRIGRPEFGRGASPACFVSRAAAWSRCPEGARLEHRVTPHESLATRYGRKEKGGSFPNWRVETRG